MQPKPKLLPQHHVEEVEASDYRTNKKALRRENRLTVAVYLFFKTTALEGHTVLSTRSSRNNMRHNAKDRH